MEITKDKITEIFCIIDDFCKEYDAEIEKMAISEPNGGKHRRHKWAMSRSEIMAILIYFHFNTFRNFKHYYLFYVKNHLCDLFPNQLSYNRFIELELSFRTASPSFMNFNFHDSCINSYIWIY